jgi:hypothetical protein
MSDELLYNTAHGGGYQLPAMLQQKERVVSVGHSRETGKKLTACRSRESRRGGGKGKGMATHLAVIQGYNHRKRLANI